MNNKLAVENHKKFCELEGSEYIATEFALEIILNLIKKFEIRSVFEIGLGIGSIADTAFSYANNNNINLTYLGTEKNEFCLVNLKKNVGEYKKLEIYSDITEIQNKKFDLIIIDGYDNRLNEISLFCKKNTIIFIEGDRQEQLLEVLNCFPKAKYVHIITLNKNKSYSKGNVNNYIGGGKLIFTNPTFKMLNYWLNHKIKTFIKYKVRYYFK